MPGLYLFALVGELPFNLWLKFFTTIGNSDIAVTGVCQSSSRPSVRGEKPENGLE